MDCSVSGASDSKRRLVRKLWSIKGLTESGIRQVLAAQGTHSTKHEIHQAATEHLDAFVEDVTLHDTDGGEFTLAIAPLKKTLPALMDYAGWRAAFAEALERCPQSAQVQW